MDDRKWAGGGGRAKEGGVGGEGGKAVGERMDGERGWRREVGRRVWMMSFFSYKDVDDGDDDVDYEEDVNLRLPEVMNRCCSHGWSARDEASTPGRSSRLPHSSRNGLWRTGAHRNGDILPPPLPSFLVHPDPPSRCPYLPSSLPLFAIGLTHLGRLLQRDSKRVDAEPPNP